MHNIEMLESIPRSSICRPTEYNSFADSRELFILPKLQSAIHAVIEDWGSTRAKPAPRLLDIGCGEQPYRKSIESKGFKYESFDIEQNQTGSVHFLGRLDSALPESITRAPKFDYIFCTEVTEHVLDWDTLFKNVSGLLEEGGKVLITCPFFFPLHEEPYDYWRPSLHALQGWGTLHGLKTVSMKKTGTAVDVLGILLGHFLLSMQYIRPTSPLSRFTLSLKQRAVRGIVKFFHTLVKKGFFNENFDGVADLYVSNIIVFEKPKRS